MKNVALPYAISLLVLLGVGYGFWRARQADRAAIRRESLTVGLTSRERESRTPLTEFTLTERNETTFHSKEMAGDVWVVSFFFCSCPGSCFQLNQGLASLQNDEGLQGLKILSITCDPDNDTPRVLRDYADRMGADPARWLFCTGEFAYLKRLGTDLLKLAVAKQTHSDRAVVIDRSGVVRGRYMVTDANELTKMKLVLGECLSEALPR